MASIMHTADVADPLLRPHGADSASRRSLLDRIDSPRAVFALLGGAAIIGLGLAFGVVHGLEQFGGTTRTAKAPTVAPKTHAESAPNSGLGKTLSPQLQYQEMNGAAKARPDAPSVATAPTETFKLNAPFIPRIARTGSMVALAAAPHVDPKARVTPFAPLAAPRVDTVARTEAPAAMAAPPRIDTTARGSADAERRVASVLEAAARTGGQPADAVLDAAGAVRSREPIRTDNTNPATARRFNEEANRAYWINHDVREALQLARRAYDANPNDVEIAGNLAFYYLKQTPPNAQAAHEVAMRALTTTSTRYRTGRLEDWVSLGIASALMGRSQEAERAFLAGAALGNNLDRTCRAALNAVATYGDAVRPAASALFRQIDAQGRSDASPYCQWPADWGLGRRMP